MLKVEGLSKSYPGFSLADVSFSLPKGYIMGFIGMNGAGKTTTLKSVLNIVRRDSGKITVFGKDMDADETAIKQQLAFMAGTVSYYPRTRAYALADIYKRFYSEWDEAAFKKYLQKFNLDINKKLNEFSAGMKVKFGLSLALSHNAKLLILDEPTGGLDPIARDELLDVFAGIVEGGERSILFSTHITADLDKCADFILFIKNGRIIANDTKDNLIDGHLVIRGGNEVLSGISEKLVGVKKNSYGFSGLIKKEDFNGGTGLKAERPNLEDIMVYCSK